jgi:glutaminyl-peptide cyclotransferase
MRCVRISHLVLATIVLSALGILAFVLVRAVPAGEGAGEMPPVAPSNSSTTPAPTDVALYRYKIVKLYPHDRRFFTQGLVYEDGFLYEGTGLYGQSALYKRELQTGKTVKMLRLPDQYFGEGIALFGDKLIELTWQSNVGFVYKKDTFTPLSQFKYSGEGWGLTHDGKRLILSDGTATLRFLDPNTYAETGRIEVRDRNRPVERLNELEYVATPVDSQPGVVGPQIFANIWATDQIVIIDPQTGRVTGRIDMSGLWTPPADEEGESVLNGIAYLPQTRHLLVTGKCWPRLYEIELVKETR